jgi:hypothetical protein
MFIFGNKNKGRGRVKAGGRKEGVMLEKKERKKGGACGT